MDTATPRSDFYGEMQATLQTRALYLAGFGSIVLGQLLILYGQRRDLAMEIGLAGLFVTLLGAVVLVASPLSLRLRLLAFSVLYIVLILVTYRSTQASLLLIGLVVPIALISLVTQPVVGVVLAAAASLGILIWVPSTTYALGIAPIIASMIIATFSTVFWIVFSFASDAVDWSWSNFERMRELLEREREQRILLDDTQHDLQQANIELARVSDRLRAMHQMAEAARRAKDEFVANVSHELRTPLNMIIGFSEMIAQEPDLYGQSLPPQLLADIEVIQRNSRHLSGLVDDVLDLSQVEAGRMALSREWVDLGEVAETAARAVEPLFVSRGLTLAIDVPPGLPEVYCDRVRIRQVILNLLSNAGRFTSEGGATVRIQRRGQAVEISVADTGPGIPLEAQERIFEPFEQFDGSIQRQVGGSGLGLAISRRFVEMHGGRMWLESTPGEGTTFYARLPIEVPVAEPGAPGVTRWFSPYETYEARSRPSRAPMPDIPPRLIVLEEGDTLRRFLQRYYPDMELASTSSLEAAIAEAARLPARALLINESGRESRPPAYEQLRDLAYATPVLHCHIADGDIAERLGIHDYLTKPISRERLQEAIASLDRDISSILIVDDQVEALQLFGRMLSGEGGQPYRLMRATTGRRALQLLRRHKPDLMLLDLIMPDMNGYDVLREKAADPAICQIPVLAISALDTTPGGLVSEYLTVTRGMGLQLSEFLSCLQTLPEILAPPDRSGGRGRPETPRG